MEQTSVNAGKAQDEIDILARALGWPAGKRGKQALPSTWYLAKVTGEEALYNGCEVNTGYKVIFHATSRTVHFTISELLRLAWGTSAEIRVSNRMMSSCWREFVLYWGLAIVLLHIRRSGGAIGGLAVALPDMEPDAESRFGALSISFSKCGPVPIITPQEMNLHLSGKQIDDIFRSGDEEKPKEVEC